MMMTINERTCITCHWAGWDYVAEDFTCRNPNSAWTNEYVGSDMTCPQWKEPESKGEVWYE